MDNKAFNCRNCVGIISEILKREDEITSTWTDINTKNSKSKCSLPLKINALKILACHISDINIQPLKHEMQINQFQIISLYANFSVSQYHIPAMSPNVFRS